MAGAMLACCENCGYELAINDGGLDPDKLRDCPICGRHGRSVFKRYLPESDSSSLLRGLAEDLTARAAFAESASQDEAKRDVERAQLAGGAYALRGAVSLIRAGLSEGVAAGGPGFDSPVTPTQGDNSKAESRQSASPLAESDPQTPEDTEPRCPTCGSIEPKIRWHNGSDPGIRHYADHKAAGWYVRCADPWHSGSVQHGQGNG